MNKWLIVNGDDYGHTAGISKGIRMAHLNGILTSTSAMMNRPCAPEELKTAGEECPKLGIGVHLVLTTGKPLLALEKVASLVRPDGLFFKADPFVQHLQQVNVDEVWAEWNAQVELFIKVTGHMPEHLDSHHHSSYYTPALFERMLRLAEQLSCPIRKPAFEDFLPMKVTPKELSVFSGLMEKFKPKTTQVFIGSFYDETATLENLNLILNTIAEDHEHETFELMSHPAVVDDDLRATSDYNEVRARELAILQDGGVKDVVHELGIRLIRYSDLSK